MEGENVVECFGRDMSGYMVGEEERGCIEAGQVIDESLSIRSHGLIRYHIQKQKQKSRIKTDAYL